MPPRAPEEGRRRGALRRPLGLRLLPMTIFGAVLMLGVRVGDLWHYATGRNDVAILSATAQQQPAPAGQPVGAVQAEPPAVAPSPSPAPVIKPGDDTAKAASRQQPPPPPLVQPQADPAAQGGEVTGMKNELLTRLNERREELDRRNRELEQREALLTAAEQRIDQKVAELTQLRSNIEKLLRQADEQQAAKIGSLVKIYETMKPKEAARIFEELDMPVLLDVLERMKEAKSAPIFAAMDPVKAKEVTTRLAERRSLPPGADAAR